MNRLSLIALALLLWLTWLAASSPWSTPLEIALKIVPAWAFGLAGLVAWHRRPDNRIGPLMVAIGAAILMYFLRESSVPGLVSLALWMSLGPGVLGILLCVLVLGYPTGQIRSPLERAWVMLAVVWAVGPQLAFTLATPVGTRGCVECRPLLVLWYDERVRLTLQNASLLAFALLTVLFVVLLIRRSLKASTPARRALAPVWLAGALVPVIAVILAIVDSSSDEMMMLGDSAVPSLGQFFRSRVSPVIWELIPWVAAVSLLLIPLALLWGLLRGHLGQAAVSTLAIELRRTGGRASLIESLRRAVGDRSLDLVLWSRPAGGYVTTEGLPASPPSETAGRSVTRLEGEDGPLAALIHDPMVAEQRSLMEGVSAVAQLAIENERLHAEVKSQLEEVRASRERIVRAGDEERRRVERDIHDGAQQRLVSVSLALTLAQAEAAQASPDVTATLARAEIELRQAIGELRELARGIHPAILTEAGLAAALDSLAERSPIPVSVETDLGGRLPPLVEATAYFVVAEALTNVAKHAAASRVALTATVADGWLRLTVSDDGAGGADATRGRGLRGLLDRVAALGGRFSIEDGGTGGTRLSAEIPCA